jgi:hypothetical protein
MDTAHTEEDTVLSRMEPWSCNDTHTTQHRVIAPAKRPYGVLCSAGLMNPAVRRAINELIWDSDVRENVVGTFRGDPLDYFLSHHDTRSSEEGPLCSLAPKWSRYHAGYLACPGGRITTVWFRCDADEAPYIEQTDARVHELTDGIHVSSRDVIFFLFHLYEAKVRRTAPLISEINEQLRRCVERI